MDDAELHVKSKVVLHLGAYKTATTYLQTTLAHNRATLQQQNWRFICLHKERQDVFLRIQAMRKDKTLAPGVDDVVDSFFSELREEKRNVFLSSEVLLGKMTIHDGGFFTDHARNAAFLKSQLGMRDVTVGFCIRDFADYVESSYKFMLRMGLTQDFKSYVESMSVRNLSWIAIVESLVGEFGAENVRLWAYEDFKKNSVESLRAIFMESSLDPSNMKIVREPKNVSVEDHTLRLALQWNKLLKKNRGLTSTQKKTLRQKMRSLLVKNPREKDALKPILGLRQARELRFFFEESLATSSKAPGEEALTLIARTDEFLRKSHLPSPMPLLSAGKRAALMARYIGDVAKIRARWPELFLSLPA
jgi:hypothetical protein